MIAAFLGESIHCLAMEEPIQVSIQGYTEQLTFMVAPLHGADAIIGIKWRRNKAMIPDYVNNTIFFLHQGRKITIKAGHKGETIRLVNHTQVKREVKKEAMSYLLFIRDISHEVMKSEDHLTKER